MATKAPTSNEKITEALHLLDEAAREKKGELQDVINEKFTHLKAQLGTAEAGVRERLDTAKKRAVDAAVHAREVSQEKAQEIARNVDENVHRNPWPYIGGAAVGGLLLGYILGRKN